MQTHGRIATPAQATAVAARDAGCVFPGCWAPPRLCHVHHVQWWSRGGRTHTDNLALLCWRHHQLIHAPVKHPDDAWTLTMINDQPYLIQPRWLDPNQSPLRNTLRDAVHYARQEATRLLHESQAPP